MCIAIDLIFFSLKGFLVLYFKLKLTLLWVIFNFAILAHTSIQSFVYSIEMPTNREFLVKSASKPEREGHLKYNV